MLEFIWIEMDHVLSLFYEILFKEDIRAEVEGFPKK